MFSMPDIASLFCSLVYTKVRSFSIFLSYLKVKYDLKDFYVRGEYNVSTHFSKVIDELSSNSYK